MVIKCDVLGFVFWVDVRCGFGFLFLLLSLVVPSTLDFERRRERERLGEEGKRERSEKEQGI